MLTTNWVAGGNSKWVAVECPLANAIAGFSLLVPLLPPWLSRAILGKWKLSIPSLTSFKF